MRDLTPVRLVAGGTRLVLADEQGVEHAVDVLALRATLDRAGTTEVLTGPQRKEQSVESTLRPRDIQARIRAGETPEDVATVAGTSVEKVMIFASPVLAERAHVAHSALGASVRRTAPDSHAPAVTTARTLGAAAETRLRDAGIDPASVTWDAWRREDGRWTLQAGYHDRGAAEDRRARYSYDQRGHFVQADDDDARWLVGDGQVPSRTARPADPVGAAEQAPGLRLAPPYIDARVDPGVDPGPAELGDDALDLVAGDIADTDWIASEARDNPAVPAQATTRSLAEDPADTTPAEQAPVAGKQRGTEADRSADPAEEPGPPAQRRQVGKKNRGRASVPSWDEIMFGGGS